ncbi:MAG TPA: hypothetical protein VFT46_07405, partial [Holophagaceae bacterium]|nr:hypothetical protein [Holophagaceae bacterium]
LQFVGGYTLRSQSLWRLIKSNQLNLTSLDDGQRFGLGHPIDALVSLSDQLSGMAVRAITVMEGTADLTLDFGENKLQIISDSSGYEAWQILGPDGLVAVGQGGGHIQNFN